MEEDMLSCLNARHRR